MNIYDYLPKFNQLEVNNLRGLRSGAVVAQFNVKAGSKLLVGATSDGDKVFVENGRLAILTKDGIDAAVGTEAVVFIVDNGPLTRVVDQCNTYAVDTREEDVRLVQLMPGDEWTSSIAPEDTVYAAFIKAGDIVELKGTGGLSKDDFFANDEFPDGTKAHHYVYLGHKEVVASGH